MSLTEAERANLDGLASRITGRDLHFDDLVEMYRQFVDQVDGYAFSIYDYDNDVSTRYVIDEVLKHVPSKVRQELFPSIAEIDSRFLRETVEVDRPLRGVDPDCPWYRRLPRNPGPELADDIQRGNL